MLWWLLIPGLLGCGALLAVLPRLYLLATGRSPFASEFLEHARETLSRWEGVIAENRRVLQQTWAGMDSGAADEIPPEAIDDVQQTIEHAFVLAQQPETLSDAAVLLEEALARNPELRGQYEYQVELWRRGVSM
ncbi:MAG: hypothetical protein ACYC7E_00300 [Armatimonadota bacterium]